MVTHSKTYGKVVSNQFTEMEVTTKLTYVLQFSIGEGEDQRVAYLSPSEAFEVLRQITSWLPTLHAFGR